MINADKLEQAIRNSGKKRKFLAKKLGITPPTFKRYCAAPHMMRMEQVDILCKELCITDLSKREEIFFANSDECNLSNLSKEERENP